MSEHGRSNRPVPWALGILALLAYVPALTAAPGRMPSDSKLYLYLDPGRFLGDAASTFDPRQFAGWVPHQHVAYLWPSGPWFWVFETLGAPDWIAHRLWIGTLLLAGGLGVRWCARLLGLGQVAALVAAIVYQTSPYILPYVSRTSVMLLPWAGLGWIVALTVRATRRRAWHDPALIALVVFTVGAVNATALAMIVPAPVLWLMHAVWQRSVSWRGAIDVALRVVLLTVPVSLWWMVMLVIQGRYGAEVLPYSESLADVSLTATGPEVWRSMGYWLFYVRDASTAATTESLRYLSSTPAIAVSYLVPLLGLAGLAFVRWPHRRFAALLVVAGALLSVGVHPIDDRSPLMRLLAGDDAGGLALALRSSTRALPMMNLGIALGIGMLVSATVDRRAVRASLPERPWGGRLHRHRVVGAAMAAIAIVNLPALWTGAFVDPALERDQQPPEAWLAAAEALDESGTRGRVLQIPGAEFGAFAWGYTVDQPLPGLTRKPLVTRDLLPLGSPAAMDLLYALDDRIQDGALEPGSVAPVSRWLGVDTIWVADDLDTRRFRTAEPADVSATLSAAEAIGAGRSFDGSVTLHPVEPGGSVVRARGSDSAVVVSGSGEGLVDLAAAGLLDGTELVRYSASLDDTDRKAAVRSAAALLVTDSNRSRARHWRSSQDTLGATESDQPGLELLRDVPSDQRLPVFAARDDAVDPDTRTFARQMGPVTATATSYGEPFAYLPERRPVMAIDGDPTTAWTIGEHADPVGEILRLTFAGPVGGIQLVQPDPRGGRQITEIVLRTDTAPPRRIVLDDAAVTPLDVGGATTVDIEIAAVGGGQPFTAGAVQGVGFAEVVAGLPPTIEVVQLPHDALAIVGSDTPLAIVGTRWRADATDRWRSDPEPVLARSFELPAPRTVAASVEVRVDARADDRALAELFGWPAWASTRRTGSVLDSGSAALDGDPTTAWTTEVAAAVGATLTIAATNEPTSTIEMLQPPDGSTITALTLRSGGEQRTVAVTAGPDGRSTSVVDPPLPAGQLEIEIAAITPRTFRDLRYGDPLEAPAAVAEVSGPGIPVGAPLVDAAAALGCLPILDVDGSVERFDVTVAVADASTGAASIATACDGPLDLTAGVHVVVGRDADLPITVDRVTLDSGAAAAIAEAIVVPLPRSRLVDDGRFSRTIEVSDCPDGCWLVLGEGYSTAWEASVAGVALGKPQLVDGGFNGWWLSGADEPRLVEVSWPPQRWLVRALLASAVGVLAAIALAVVTRRQPASPLLVPPPSWSWIEPRLAAVPVRRGRLSMLLMRSRDSFETRATVLVVLWAGLAGLLIQPEWAVWGAIAGFGAVLWQRPRLPELTALATVAVVAALVVIRERRNAPPAGGGWPGVFESWHGLAMFAVVSLLVGALVADDGEVRPTRRPDQIDE